MTLARQCCCNPGEPLVCCGEWPTYCAQPVGLGYWWYCIHWDRVYQGASITFTHSASGLSLSADYHSSTTAVDPDTLLPFCSFPEPLDEYPYAVVTPGVPPVEIRPSNYSVPVWRGSTASEGEYEIVWPILHRCCHGGDLDALVVGFELRGSGAISKFLGSLGTSPNDLTGDYNGTGRHWYMTSLGHLRFFADPGLWQRPPTAAGLASFSPFRLGHGPGPTTIALTGSTVLSFSHQDWCLENGRDHPCGCGFSWSEDPDCCEYYTLSLDWVYSDWCATHTVSTSCLLRFPPSTCPMSLPQDIVTPKNAGALYGGAVPTGTYTADKVDAGGGICCDIVTPQPPGYGFTTPVVTAAVVKCGAVAADVGCATFCETIAPGDFDAVVCVTTGGNLLGAGSGADPCNAVFATSQIWVIGLHFRSNGSGCCPEEYQVRRAYLLVDPGTGCEWVPLDLTGSFSCV